MAERILSVPLLAVVLTACQVGPIEIVECRTSKDCAKDEFCERPAQRCSPNPSDPGDSMVPDPDAKFSGTRLTWGETGVVLASQNSLGIAGPWYTYDDCSSVLTGIAAGTVLCPGSAPTPSCCTWRDPALVGPAPESKPGFEVTAGELGVSSGTACVRGKVAQGLGTTSQWGTGLALTLGDWSAYDATRTFPGGRIIGFQFDVDGPATGTHPIRVGLGTLDNDSHAKSLDVPAHDATLYFSEVTNASYHEPPVPLDLTQLARLAFEPAFPDPTGAVSYDFCVSNLRVLQEEPPAVPQEGLTASPALAWSELGEVAPSTNAYGIDGVWALIDDCMLAKPAIASGELLCPADWQTPSCCTEYDASLTGPPPESHPGLHVTPPEGAEPGRACIKGTATRVVTDAGGQARYDLGYGLNLELLLNHGLPFDAAGLREGGPIVGFLLDLEGPPSTLRLGVRGVSDDPYFIDVAVPTKNAQLLFSAAKQGDWAMPALPLDPSVLNALSFGVVTNVDSATPFDLCVSNVRLLQDPSGAP